MGSLVGRAGSLTDVRAENPPMPSPYHSAEGRSCPPGGAMCRNIKMLFNFEPPATEAEIRDASLQFVRKLMRWPFTSSPA